MLDLNSLTLPSYFYRIHSFNRISKTEVYLDSLPQSHQELLKSYREHLDNVRSCIEQNYSVIRLILKDVGYLFENIDPEETNPRTVSIFNNLTSSHSDILIHYSFLADSISSYYPRRNRPGKSAIYFKTIRQRLECWRQRGKKSLLSTYYWWNHQPIP